MRVAWNARTRGSARVVLIVAAVTVAIAVHGLWSWTGTRPMVGIAGAQSESAFGPPADAFARGFELAGGVVEPEDLDRLAAAHAIIKAPPEVELAVEALADERARIAAALQGSFEPVEARDLAENPLVPPRMDAGDPNPDRLNAAPPPFIAADRKAVRE